MKRNALLLAALAVAVVAAVIVVRPTPAFDPDRPDAEQDHIRVEVRGRLDTGIVAIGGETTGVTITARGAVWELDLGNDAELRRAAEKLAGRRVDLTGDLEVREGVEVRQRWIVTVRTLHAAGDE
jgi:hypothetical protein